MEKLAAKEEELNSLEKKLDDSSNEKSILQEQVEKLDELESLKVCFFPTCFIMS